MRFLLALLLLAVSSQSFAVTFGMTSGEVRRSSNSPGTLYYTNKTLAEACQAYGALYGYPMDGTVGSVSTLQYPNGLFFYRAKCNPDRSTDIYVFPDYGLGHPNSLCPANSTYNATKGGCDPNEGYSAVKNPSGGWTVKPKGQECEAEGKVYNEETGMCEEPSNVPDCSDKKDEVWIVGFSLGEECSSKPLNGCEYKSSWEGQTAACVSVGAGLGDLSGTDCGCWMTGSGEPYPDLEAPSTETGGGPKNYDGSPDKDGDPDTIPPNEKPGGGGGGGDTGGVDPVEPPGCDPTVDHCGGECDPYTQNCNPPPDPCPDGNCGPGDLGLDGIQIGEGDVTSHGLLDKLLDGPLAGFLDWTAPAHYSECPTGSFEYEGSTFRIDSHCDYAEQNRSLISVLMVLAWTIIAIFIVLSA
jgi:hypothetical protein